MGKVYAVYKGYVPGIYYTWTDCQAQTRGFSGAVYKGFDSYEEAQTYLTLQTKAHERVASSNVVRTVVYTDGASNANGSGWAAVVIQGDKHLGYHGKVLNYGATATSQFSELFAIYKALVFTSGPLLIFTDSRYSIGVLSDFGWKIEANVYLINTIKFLLASRDVEFRHVRGHSGDPGNELADQYAVIGSMSPLNISNVVPNGNGGFYEFSY